MHVLHSQRGEAAYVYSFVSFAMVLQIMEKQLHLSCALLVKRKDSTKIPTSHYLMLNSSLQSSYSHPNRI